MFLITIPGTHELFHEDGWWQPDSHWWREAKREGFRHPAPEDPFFWSTDLEGTMGENYEWMAAGAALHWWVLYYLGHGDGDYRDFGIVAWSHGGQVAAHFLNRYRWEIGVLARAKMVTLGTPVRPEMTDLYHEASLNAEWVHVYSDQDAWQVFGELSEMEWSFDREMAYAGKNVNIGSLPHEALTKPWLWTNAGLWNYLRDGS